MYNYVISLLKIYYFLTVTLPDIFKTASKESHDLAMTNPIPLYIFKLKYCSNSPGACYFLGVSRVTEER